MKCIYADWLVTCESDFLVLQEGAICFDKKILGIDTKANLQKKYPNESFEYLGENSVLMPGLINAHVHLEFSANATTLTYGNFVQWLLSLIQNREELIEKADKKLIDSELRKMLQTGTTTIGAISSYGFDLSSCVQTPLNVVYFTEILGSNPQMIDSVFVDFQERLKLAQEHESERFIPAVAIHSPYATHPILVQEVLKIAREKNMAVSAHFQESHAENEWLNYSSGEFEDFFKDMLDQHESLIKPSDFLYQFQGLEKLSFTHCVRANQKELKQIHDLGATIIHCPTSNRLLSNTALNLSYLEEIPLAMGSDGLSSNSSLNLFDELKNALFIHNNFNTNELCQKLLTAATKGGGVALGLQKGVLEEGYDADIISFILPDKVNDMQDIASAIVLHNKEVTKTYIQGNLITQ